MWPGVSSRLITWSRYSICITELATEMPRCFSISIQSEVAWREALRALTEPAIWIAPENSSSFSVSVVLPASGWEMIAKVRRRRVSAAKGEADKRELRRTGANPLLCRLGATLMAHPPRMSAPRRPGRENLRQLEIGRDLELVIAAIAGRLVRAPAQEDGGMTEALALQVIVFDFANALGPNRFP